MSPGKAHASDGPAPDSLDEVRTVRIELVDSDPLIWREVDVLTSVTLNVLHEVVQVTMGWSDEHLWEFRIGGRIYGLPMDEDWGTAPRVTASTVRLRDILEPRRTTISYLYDFGDGWEHRLTVTKVRSGTPGTSYPRYASGERNCPPEDCGGILSFHDLLDALADPRHVEHKRTVMYLDGWDPARIDELPLGMALKRIAHRQAPATRSRRS